MLLSISAAALALIPQTPSGLDDLGELSEERRSIRASDWLVERPEETAQLLRDAATGSLVLDNGLLRRTFTLYPSGEAAGSASERLTGFAATSMVDLSQGGEALLRAVSPEAFLQVDGVSLAVGGAAGQPNGAFVGGAWLKALRAGDAAPSDPSSGPAFELRSVRTQAIGEDESPSGTSWARIDWTPGRGRPCSADATWPPAGIEAIFEFGPARADVPDLTVRVHYALFDGLPAYAKWITVVNDSARPVTLERITTEILRAVEHSSWVESRGVDQPTPPVHVETDYAFGGMVRSNANAHVVHWRADPTYLSQVSYERTTPCLLEVSPSLGPHARIEPGSVFRSYRTFVLAVGSRSGRERSGLARKRLVRTIAPWTTENPLMMHVRWSDEETVANAIRQCAEVGFEMVILTFGSGFNAENRDPEYLAKMRRYAELAAESGVEIGGYSLLSSRRVEPATDNCIHPETGEPGADIHGSCPSLTSAFGQAYFQTLRSFYEATGFRLLEHDGSYPGTPDAAARPPLQSGLENSVWAQWSVIDDFYRWCRSRDIYLNVPDHYYLAGASKCGMGYREVNWSLPRADQVLHTRQNIYDGTWEKTPSMGWMFVPLSEYHGGGRAATIEPLAEHLEHYRAMLLSNLALGVQACYRGPRLYDTEATRAEVKAAVDWFKANRRILEADLVHGRRADGRDIDWMMHVDPMAPEGEPRGLVVVFNPLAEAVTRWLRVPLEFTGLAAEAAVEVTQPEGYPARFPSGSTQGSTNRKDEVAVTRRVQVAGGVLDVEVTVPAGGMRLVFLR